MLNYRTLQKKASGRAEKVKSVPSKRASTSQDGQESRLVSSNSRRLRLDTLPVPVLVHILSFVVAERGVGFLRRIERFCKSFREASRDPRLWRKLDLQSGDITDNLADWLSYLKLISTNCVEEVVFSGCKKLKPVNLLQLASSCPRLHSVSVCDCRSLNGEALVQLCTVRPGLRLLDLSQMCVSDLFCAACGHVPWPGRRNPYSFESELCHVSSPSSCYGGHPTTLQ